MRIHDILSAKSSHEVVTITPQASVRDLVALLSEHNIGAVIVSADGASVDGIVSERDVVRRLASGGDVMDASVADIMTTRVQTCRGDDDLTDLMRVMTEHRIRHLPVVDGARLVGVVSIGDVVKHRIGELEFERDQLDHYVHRT